jgi:large subunit ribosomal protein L17
MRHRVPKNRLGRPQDQRKALLRSLVTELLRHDEITTTLAKAKALRPCAERIITKAKHGYLKDRTDVLKKADGGDADATRTLTRSLHLRRQIAAFVHDKSVISKLMSETAERYMERNGGYTRIIKTGMRRGDATEMAIIQLV